MSIITSTAGQVNTGRDIQISLVSGQGTEAVGQFGGSGIVTVINNITQFEYKQDTIDIMKTKLDATTILADLPRFWSGSIEFVRADSNIDTLFDKIEQAWYTGGAFLLGHMLVTITNPVSGNTIMTFKDVSVKLEDGGSFKAEDLVTTRITWRAAQRTM